MSIKHEKEKSFKGLCEWAWGIIANANEGNWEKAEPKWKECAEKWRDNYHELLNKAEEVEK